MKGKEMKKFGLLRNEGFDSFEFEETVTRAGNEPSYSGLARKKLDSSSARELNEPSLSLNLGLINLGLGSKKARLWPPGPIRRWNEAFAYGLRLARSGLHRCDPDSGAPE